MPLMNGSKMARHQASIVNLPNCGGNKKAGTGPRIGWFLTSNPSMFGAPQRPMYACMINRVTPTQKTGYRATHSPI